MSTFPTPEEFFESLDHPERVPNDEIVPPGERRCPICGERMSIDSEKGIRFDSCPAHGVWFDRGSLSAFKARVQAEVERARQQGLDAGLTCIAAFEFLDGFGD